MSDQPKPTTKHEKLGIFVSRWTARGTSYGGTDQSGSDPKANGEPWLSTHEARWRTGKFFLIQDERADIGGKRFDTLSVLGVGEDGEYFSRGFENHGFYRNYVLTRDNGSWHFNGPSERATVIFSNEGRRQVWVWEWKPADCWLPLCDRIADRID